MTLVLGALHQPHHLFDEVERKSVYPSDALGCLIAFDVGLKNGVEDLIRGQRVGIFLIGPEFGGGRLLENGARNNDRVRD